MNNYLEEDMEYINVKIKELYQIISGLEDRFEGRKFTLDGHVVGSIGEVIASYLYDLTLLPASTEKHDAITNDGKRVQIKATQGNKGVGLRGEPDYLIVLKIDKHTGEAIEIYNGRGKPAWECAGKLASNGQRAISISTLKKLAVEEKKYRI